MEEKGFIILHRQILDWEWYDHLPTKVLFIHCLLRANHASGSWRGQSFKRGQFITSLQSLSKETGLTIKQVRIALENLEKTKELGKQTTSQNTLITVLNYDFYQSRGKQTGKVRANEGQSKGKRGANEGQQINNDNNDNNDNNKKQVYRSFDHLQLSVDEFNSVNKKYTKSEIDLMLDSIENYKGNKKYNSLNLTLQSWLRKEHGVRIEQKQAVKEESKFETLY